MTSNDNDIQSAKGKLTQQLNVLQVKKNHAQNQR